MSTFLGNTTDGPSWAFIAIAAFVSLTVASIILREWAREDASAYVLIFLFSGISTLVLMLLGMAVGASPRITGVVVGGLAGGLIWTWLLTRIRSPKKLLTALRLAFNRVEARQKRAALELADAEKRLLQLKSDPAYQQAMREVDVMLNPFGKAS